MPSQRLLDELMATWIHADDAALMLAIGAGILRPQFPQIVDDFYAAIDRTPGASAVFTGGSAADRAPEGAAAQLARRAGRGVYDEAYVERRARIGRTHVRIALDQRYMFAAMSVVRAGLHTALDGAADWAAERRRRGPPGDRQAL